MKTKNKNKISDTIDHDRSGGVLLPLESQHFLKKRSKKVKDFILDNIESVLDEILEDLGEEDK